MGAPTFERARRGIGGGAWKGQLRILFRKNIFSPVPAYSSWAGGGFPARHARTRRETPTRHGRAGQREGSRSSGLSETLPLFEHIQDVSGRAGVPRRAQMPLISLICRDGGPLARAEFPRALQPWHSRDSSLAAGAAAPDNLFIACIIIRRRLHSATRNFLTAEGRARKDAASVGKRRSGGQSHRPRLFLCHTEERLLPC